MDIDEMISNLRRENALIMFEPPNVEADDKYREMKKLCKVFCDNHNSCIKALEELQEYRKLGMVKECCEARERQIPKSVEFYGDGEDGKMLCPNCKEDLWDLKECGFNNFPYCGQALKWED